MTSTSTTPKTAPRSRGRQLGFTALAALLALATAIGMGGVFALIGVFTAADEAVIHRIHSLHWGVLMVVLLGAPLAALAVRPRVAPAQQVAVVVAAFVLAALAGMVIDPVLIVFPVLTAALLALHPEGRGVFRGGEGLSPMLATLAAAVSLPSLWYALGQIQIHLAAPLADPHRGPPEHHYIGAAALVLAISGVAWLVALRTPGWRLSAWSVGLATVLNGLGSVLLPDYAGSFGPGWGAAAVVWGVAVISAAVLIGPRRDEGA